VGNHQRGVDRDADVHRRHADDPRAPGSGGLNAGLVSDAGSPLLLSGPGLVSLTATKLGPAGRRDAQRRVSARLGQRASLRHRHADAGGQLILTGLQRHQLRQQRRHHRQHHDPTGPRTVTGGGTVHTFARWRWALRRCSSWAISSTTGGNAGATFGAVTLTGAPLIVSTTAPAQRAGHRGQHQRQLQHHHRRCGAIDRAEHHRHHRRTPSTFTKWGAGVLTLAGTDFSTGALTLNGGTVIVGPSGSPRRYRPPHHVNAGTLHWAWWAA